MNSKQTRPNPAEFIRCDMTPARIILCESSGRWAVALRRELGSVAHRMEDALSVAECWNRLSDSSESLLVVEVTSGNIEGLLARMARLEREFPRARIAVVADRRLTGHEWLLREAGAVLFCTSPRQLAPLADLGRRHIEACPDRPVGPLERIWASLPWG